MIRTVILRLTESYFRHRWLYLLPVVIMSAVAVAFMMTATPKYVANGVLYVQQESYLATLTAVRNNQDSWWVSPAQATTNDLNELMQTNAFIRAMINQTKLESEMSKGDQAVGDLIAETRNSLRIFPLGDNQVVISSSSEDPEVASQLVNGVIESYVQWQVNIQRAESEAALAFFTDVLKTYEASLEAARDEMRQYLEANPEPLRGDRAGIEQIEIQRLQSNIDLLAARQANALDKEENARLSLAQLESDIRQTYLLIDAPDMPEEPDVSLRELALRMAIFVVVGVMLSFGAVAGGALLDRSLRLPVDVERSLELPLLALIPDTSTSRSRFLRRKQPRESFSVEADVLPPRMDGRASVGVEISEKIAS